MTINEDHSGYFMQPPTDFRITKLWAYVSIDPADGNEGVLTLHHDDGVIIPLIASDRVRADAFRDYAQAFAVKFGCEVKLVEFATRTEIDTIHAE